VGWWIGCFVGCLGLMDHFFKPGNESLINGDTIDRHHTEVSNKIDKVGAHPSLSYARAIASACIISVRSKILFGFVNTCCCILKSTFGLPLRQPIILWDKHKKERKAKQRDAAPKQFTKKERKKTSRHDYDPWRGASLVSVAYQTKASRDTAGNNSRAIARFSLLPPGNQCTLYTDECTSSFEDLNLPMAFLLLSCTQFLPILAAEK
jgi:hypothetical protein